MRTIILITMMAVSITANAINGFPPKGIKAKKEERTRVKDEGKRYAGRAMYKAPRVWKPKIKYRVVIAQESGNNHFTVLVEDAKGNRFWMTDTIFHLMDEGVDINEVVIMSQM